MTGKRIHFTIITMSGGRDLSQPVILQSHIVSVRERKILIFSLKVNIFHEKSEKTPGFCSKQHLPSPGFRSLLSEGLATAYAVPFPSFSVSKAFMSETERIPLRDSAPYGRAIPPRLRRGLPKSNKKTAFK